jgi:hypothetical protein
MDIDASNESIKLRGLKGSEGLSDYYRTVEIFEVCHNIFKLFCCFMINQRPFLYDVTLFTFLFHRDYFCPRKCFESYSSVGIVQDK